jgi:hypothetical protein
MRSRLELVLDLLHGSAEAALATHSTQLPGYPFASAVPFVLDDTHCPILLLSALAEHSRNLAANPRASLMIAQALGEGEMERVSLVGEMHRFDPEPLLVRRYLRYHPHAERFLQLGDFAFRRLEPKRILAVGGFARAGWLDGERLPQAPRLSLELEAELIGQLVPQLADGREILGIDAYGIDLRGAGTRRRHGFEAGPAGPETVLPTALRTLRQAGHCVE